MKRQTIYSAKVRRAVIGVISGLLWTVGGAYAAGPLTAAPPAHSEPAHAEPAHSEPAPSNNTAQPAAVNRPSAGAQANSPNASPANLRGNEGDRRNSDRNNRNNGTLYGDPWWPYAYGWGDGWDGNDNTGTFVQPTYTNTENNTAPAAAPPSSVQSSPGTPSAAANSAILANAVNKSPEMVAANNAVQLAQVAYDTERERVVAEVAKTPEYQQALARKHDAAKDLRTVKESDKGQPAVVDAATAKMDASDEVTKMREQAVATDANAVTAKTKLAEAVAEREAVRAKLMSQLGQH